MRLSGQQLYGVWVAMVTPCDEAQGVPRQYALAGLVNRFVRAGINGLFILGTTGEGTLLTPEERKQFTKAVLEQAQGKLPVIVHTGHDRTSVAAVELAIHAQLAGAVAIAVSAPGHLYRAVRMGDIAQAKRCQGLIRRVCQVVHNGTPLAFIKEGLEVLGWAVGPALSPLRALRSAERAELSRALTQLSKASIGR